MVMVKNDDRYCTVAECFTRAEAEYLLSVLNKRTWAAPPKIERRRNALYFMDTANRSQ